MATKRTSPEDDDNDNEPTKRNVKQATATVTTETKQKDEKDDKEREARHARHNDVVERVVLHCVETGDVAFLEWVMEREEKRDKKIDLNSYVCYRASLFADDIVTRSLFDRSIYNTAPLKIPEFSPDKVPMIEFLLRRGLSRESYGLVACKAYIENQTYGMLLPIINNFTRVDSDTRCMLIEKALQNTENVELIQFLLDSRDMKLHELVTKLAGQFLVWASTTMWYYRQDSQCLQVLAVIRNKVKEYAPEKNEAWFAVPCYRWAVRQGRRHGVLDAICPKALAHTEEDVRWCNAIVFDALAQGNETAVLLLYKNNWQFSSDARIRHFEEALRWKMRELTAYLVQQPSLNPGILLRLALKAGQIELGRVICVTYPLSVKGYKDSNPRSQAHFNRIMSFLQKPRRVKVLRCMAEKFDLSSDVVHTICTFLFQTMDCESIMSTYKAQVYQNALTLLTKKYNELTVDYAKEPNFRTASK